MPKHPGRGAILLAVVLIATGVVTFRNGIRRGKRSDLVYGALLLLGGLVLAGMDIASELGWGHLANR